MVMSLRFKCNRGRCGLSQAYLRKLYKSRQLPDSKIGKGDPQWQCCRRGGFSNPPAESGAQRADAKAGAPEGTPLRREGWIATAFGLAMTFLGEGHRNDEGKKGGLAASAHLNDEGNRVQGITFLIHSEYK